MNYHFEWDSAKARGNINKHKVSFQQASTIFRDAYQLSLYDVEHSQLEDRRITLGIGQRGQLLVVIHTFEQSDEKNVYIRIISARKAEQEEAMQYYSQMD